MLLQSTVGIKLGSQRGNNVAKKRLGSQQIEIPIPENKSKNPADRQVFLRNTDSNGENVETEDLVFFFPPCIFVNLLKLNTLNLLLKKQ